MNPNTSTQSVIWNDAEYGALARALIKRFPQRHFQSATSVDALEFTELEFQSVMQDTLPLARHRQHSRPNRVKPRLLAALLALPDRPAPRPRPLLTHWTDIEWRYFGLALHTLYPAFDFLHSPDMAGLKIAHLNAAGQMMAEGRRRSFAAMTSPRQKLIALYADALASGDPLFVPAATPAVQVAEVAEAVAQADAVVAVATPTVAADTAPTDGAAIEAAAKRPHVYWTKAEWIVLAGELHRQNPHAHYPDSATLAGLRAVDINAAQCALPEARRRPKLIFVKILLPHLLLAFETVRRDLARQAEQQAFEAAALVAAEAKAQAEAASKAQAEAEAAAQAEAEAQLQAQALASADASPWKAACQPLISLLVAELATLLVDELSTQLLPQIVQQLKARNAPAVTLPFMPPQRPSATVIAPAPAAPKPLPHVGVVGNRTSYAEELRREFPQIDFTCIDTQNKIDSVKNCIKVIVLTKFVSHDLDKHAKRVVGERYTPINGAVSDMKRVLRGWLSDGILPTRAVAAA